MTPLMIAICARKIDEVRSLIKCGEDINLADKVRTQSISALFMAQYGDTALHKACSKGYRDMAEILLNNGANPLIKNKVDI